MITTTGFGQWFKSILHPPAAQVSAANQGWVASTAASLFNGLVPESSFKWPNIEPNKGDYAGMTTYVQSITSYAQVGRFDVGWHRPATDR